MSAYRAIVGWGRLNRRFGEHAVELPKQSAGGAYAAPSTILTDLATYLIENKWQRFGAGISCDITRNRNINYHNDIGKREYTVATTGIYEPDFTINGMVSADNLEWLMYALNMASFPQVSSNTYRFQYTAPEGPKTFDICYLQSNNKTNEYAGYDEVHILTGCAINKVTISYELGSDAGVNFSIEGYALMDYMSVASNIGDVNTYLEDIPADVFSTGCLSYSNDGSTWNTIAQTDKASLSIENFLERRGNCNTNWGSGYSMGTLNFTVETTTYSNDPKKMELVFLGYDRSETTGAIYSVKKVPYKTPYICIHTDNGDPTATGIAKDGNKRLNIVLTNAIVDTLDKKYESEQAILDEATLRGSVGYIDVYTETSGWGLGYTDTSTTSSVLGRISYDLDGGAWDADATPLFIVVADTPDTITLPTSTTVSKAENTLSGWQVVTDGTPSGTTITSIAKTTITGSSTQPVILKAIWTANV